MGRDEEAEEVLIESAELATSDDVDPQVRSRAARAQILARRGELTEARQLGHEALALAETTDFLTLRAEARLALAYVLAACSEHDEASERLHEALELFERKESLPQAEQTRRLIEAATST